MTHAGRNDPCPCGSGRKFKKCCLGKARAVPFTAADREAALARLTDFSLRRELDEERRLADGVFWAEWVDAHQEDEVRRALEMEESASASDTWFALDFVLPDGGTIIELFLEREASRLSPGEREYLDRMRDTHLKLYQVADVTPEEGLRLVDLWSGDQVWVRERLATRQLVRWDLVAVRLMQGADGDPVIDGLPYLYPIGTKDALLGALRRLHKNFRRIVGAGAEDPIAFFKRAGMLFHHFWLDTVVLRPLPRIVTAEGDPLIFAKAIFDVRDRAALLAALDRHPDLARDDDGGYGWHEDAPDVRRGLGRFVPRGDRLVFETTSKERVERGREFLESLAGDAVRFRLVEYEDPGQAMERVASSRGRPEAAAVPPEEAAVPPEVAAQVVGEYYERHYRRWLDEPVPALDNRTPRDAARLKRVRPKLIALLQEFENLAARERLQGRPAYDFGWMWAELGLERPE